MDGKEKFLPKILKMFKYHRLKLFIKQIELFVCRLESLKYYYYFDQACSIDY